ncbi:MAG: TetR family transcriptional regulator C-terminal domain-containing protein [Microscillaceae bacterium]|nr:TetR family transcriptional regulator C-terminal domain-containing protein [Microscillaceae bacterium]MDW8461717.1 TetR family transcriptional regulator C-terminal domain-containing protein [Cytophagales bacterium]
MENTESTISKEQIIEGFIKYALENEKYPKSAYQLAKFIGITEKDFYQYFGSIQAVESAIWVSFFEITLKTIEADEVYAKYSVREKLLAFYYMWLETLKENRSYILFATENLQPTQLIPAYLKEFREKFTTYVENLLAEGKETGEVASRQFIDRSYPFIFWMQALLILRFWLKDTSKNFEQTDAFVEKAVNFAFDFVGKTVFDSAFDFAKFVFQNRK